MTVWEVQGAVHSGAADASMPATLQAQGAGVVLGIESSGLTVSGEWVYHEVRTNCEPDPTEGGSTDARYPCSLFNTFRPVRHAAVQLFLRRRGGQETLLSTSMTNGDGLFLFDVPAFVRMYGDEIRVELLALRPLNDDPRSEDHVYRMITGGGVLYVAPTVYRPLTSSVYDFNTIWTLGEIILGWATLTESYELFERAIGDDMRGLDVIVEFVRSGCTEVDFLFPGRFLKGNASSIAMYVDSGDILAYVDVQCPFELTHGQVLAHEFGHRVQWEAQDGHLKDVPPNYGGHNPHLETVEQEAFKEGFANFVGTAVFFGPEATSPSFVYYGLHGLPFDPFSYWECYDPYDPGPGQTSLNPALMELSYAHFWWDVFDNSDAQDYFIDAAFQTLDWIVSVFKEFPQGNGDRETDEGDFGPKSFATDGPNVWDYEFWAKRVPEGHMSLEPEIINNCLHFATQN